MVPTRQMLFYGALVLSMSTTFLTTFLAVPIYQPLAETFEVSSGVINQLTTTYQFSQGIGVIIFGMIARRVDLLPMMVVSFLMYACIAAGLGVNLQFGIHNGLGAVFALWAVLCAVCVIGQFGLAVIKQLTDSKTEEGQRLVLKLVAAQALIAGGFQAAGPSMGSQLLKLSLAGPFYLMSGLGVLFAVLMWLLRPVAATRPESDSCSATTTVTTATTAATSNEEPPSPSPSYMAQVKQLATHSCNRDFRIYVALLSMSSLSLNYLNRLSKDSLTNAGMEDTDSSFLILIIYLPNLLFRSLPLVPVLGNCIHYDSLVRVGVCLQCVGVLALLICSLLIPLQHMPSTDAATATATSTLTGTGALTFQSASVLGLVIMSQARSSWPESGPHSPSRSPARFSPSRMT